MIFLKKHRTKIATVVAFVALLYVVGYLVAVNSAAYATAVEFVRRDQAVTAKVGTVTDASLSFLNAQLRFAGHAGNADFVIVAKTDAGAARRVRVRLENSVSGWKVLSFEVLS
jgi:hypothetical protein